MMNLEQLLLAVPGLIVAITIHEYAHGLVAYRLGDPTAARAGRLTLNPLAHLDPVGALMFWIFRFGWAKPVPVNPMYFSDPRWGMLKVSVAGPAANLIGAFAFTVGLVLAQRWGLGGLTLTVLSLGVMYNIFLGLFNVLPIPPLDGSKILRSLLPPAQAHRMDQLGQYSLIIILVLIYTGVIGRVLVPIAGMVVEVLYITARALVG